MMTHRTQQASARGFTLIELLIVTCAVALTATVVLDRLLYYQEMAEKVAMQQVVRTMRISLQLQTANLIAKNRLEDIPRLAEQNPMHWLAQPPDNYAGESISMRKESVATGQWFFDVESKKLFYLVHNGANFRSENNGPKQVAYQARVLRSETEQGVDGAGAIEGVVLEQVNAFEWFKQSLSLEMVENEKLQ